MDLDFLLYLQDLDASTGGVLRKAAELFSELGASTLTVVILLIVYWGLDKKLGYRIMFAFLFGGIINQTLKNIFCINRPWVRESRIVSTARGLASATGYSFPSGHSQTSVDFYGNIALYTRKKKVVSGIAWAIMILVPVSRLMLGVHTPQDVITGMLVGAAGVLLMLKTERWVEEKSGRDVIMLIVGAVVIAIHLLYVSFKGYDVVYAADGSMLVDPVIMVKDSYAMAGACLAALAGFGVERRYISFKVDGPVWVRTLRIALGVAVFLVLYKGIGSMDFMHPWLQAFIKMVIPFFFSVAIWPWCFTKYEKKLVAKA